MDTVSYLLGKKNGGGSGTTNYNDLSNKPSINNVSLSGNKTSSDLGIQDALVSGTNIKTINNESILGSGDITISGGGDSEIIYGEYGWELHLANDVEPGIYVTSSSQDLYLYDLTETRNRIAMNYGFFYVVKKYSEAQNNETFIVFVSDNGSLAKLRKSDNTQGYSGPYSSGSNWTNKNNVLLKDNTISWAPTGDYNPCTKKYVDDSIASAIGTALGGSY